MLAYFNVFWAFGTEIGDMYAKDDYEPLEGMSRMVTTALDAFMPLSSATLAQTITPTALDPFIQIAENKTFFGSPLMPEKDIRAKPETPDSERYWSTVSKPSKAIAQTLNKLTKGDKFEKGLIDVSPESLDLIFETMTGGAGKFLTDTLSLPEKVYKGETELKDIPGVRKFTDKTSEYKIASMYKKYTDKVHMVTKQIKEYPDRRDELTADKTYRLKKLVTKTDSKIKKLNKMIRRTDDEARKDELKERVKELKRRFNRRYLDTRKN